MNESAQVHATEKLQDLHAVQPEAEDPVPLSGRIEADVHLEMMPAPGEPGLDGAVAKQPTGSWRGMLVEENDWEMFAGLASGVMGDMRLLPPYVRRFYAGLFVGAADQDVIEA